MQLVQTLRYEPEDCVLEIFFDLILPAALWPRSRLSFYPPKNVSWRVKAAGATTENLHVPVVWKSGSLNLLERAGRVQASTGIAVIFVICQGRRPRGAV
jgi:hypothetical protein